jgi:putrescine importer
MNETASAVVETTAAPQLKSDVIGLLGAATLGVVFLSPAMTLYGLFGPIYLAAGTAAPMAFVFALIATLPTAYGYAVLSRDYPSSGSAADWSTRATTPRIGVWTGWIVFLYYFTNFVIQPVAVGLFCTELLNVAGVASNVAKGAGFLIGVLGCSVWPAWMVYRGISISARGALAVLLVEISVVVCLCATVVWLAPQRGTPLQLDGFSFTGATQNVSAMFQAMVFAMLGFCGFDVISTVAEETKMARKLIPKATMLALLFYAVIIIAGMWALTLGGKPEALKQAVADGRMPINDVARSFWGRGSLLVTLTGISASLGLAIVTSVGASRILFSMGRGGTAPARFARLHPKFQVPWNSLHVIFAGGLVGAIVLFSLTGAYNAYVWWATTSTFFAMLTYLFVNVAVILLNRERLAGSVRGFIFYAIIPAVGIAADGYILVQSFFIELWAQPWITGKSVVVFDVACATAALLLAFAFKPASRTEA